MIHLAADRDILGDVAVMDGIRTHVALIGGLIQREHDVVVAVLVKSHILLGQNGAAGEEGLILVGGNVHADRLRNGDLFLIELVLHFADGRAQTMAVHGIGPVIISAEDNAPVLHGRHAEKGSRNMDDGIDVGKSDIENGISLGRAIAVGHSVHAGKILGGFHELIPVLHRQRSAAESDGAVGGADFRIHDLAEHLDAGSVRSGGPGADHNIGIHVHVAHGLAEQQSSVVVSEDVDDLSVLKQRSQVLEGRLMAIRAHCHDDEPRALDSLCHVAGVHVEIGLAAAVETIAVGLRTDEVDSGLFKVLQGLCRERHRVKKSDLLAVSDSQLAVSSNGLSDSAAADDSNRFILQVGHIAHNSAPFFDSA